MFCRNCGTALEEETRVCPNCGTEAAEQPAVVEPVAAPAPQPVAPAPQPVPVATPQPVIPEEYRPLGAWSYVGLQILFSLPVIGLIFLIIFTFKKSNLCRRSFARSYWCWALIVAVICVIIVLLSFTGAVSIPEVF